MNESEQRAAFELAASASEKLLGIVIDRELLWPGWLLAVSAHNHLVSVPSTCSCCHTTDVQVNVVCHNSSCTAYAEEVEVYRGWD